MIDLCGLLALSSPLCEDDVAPDVAGEVGGHGTLLGHQAHLFSMLQVEPVALGQPPVHGGLHPHDLVDERVPPLLEQVQAELVLRINHPHEKKAVSLQLGDGQVRDIHICELTVAQRHAAGGVRSGELPWRVHHDRVELRACGQRLPIVRGHVRMDGDTLRGYHPLGGVYVGHVAFLHVFLLVDALGFCLLNLDTFRQELIRHILHHCVRMLLQ
mmetsp:Transcript_39132/g.65759  ORF Transcript_39132/g.65759 Transcript_39132/m.65759 type:complete len:214 (-) Transcript_39132:540-1181(-)